MINPNTIKGGMKVLIIDGQNKDKFGTYLYHDRDSGYYVPFIRLEDGSTVKPWDREVICLDTLIDEKNDLEEKLIEVEEQIQKWFSLKGE